MPLVIAKVIVCVIAVAMAMRTVAVGYLASVELVGGGSGGAVKVLHLLLPLLMVLPWLPLPPALPPMPPLAETITASASDPAAATG